MYICKYMLLFTNVVFSKYDFGVHCWSCTSYEKLIKFIEKSKNYLRTFVVKSMLPFHMAKYTEQITFLYYSIMSIKKQSCDLAENSTAIKAIL